VDPKVSVDDGFDELDELIAELSEEPATRDALADAEELFRALRLLRAHRKGQHLKQSKVAERMGTTQSAVSKLEGGANDPQITTLMRYARAVDARVCLVARLDTVASPDTSAWIKSAATRPARSTRVRPMAAPITRRYLEPVIEVA